MPIRFTNRLHSQSIFRSNNQTAKHRSFLKSCCSNKMTVVGVDLFCTKTETTKQIFVALKGTTMSVVTKGDDKSANRSLVTLELLILMAPSGFIATMFVERRISSCMPQFGRTVQAPRNIGLPSGEC